MLRRIWRRIVQFFQRLFGPDSSSRTYRATGRTQVYSSSTQENKPLEAAKPLESSDYEFLFMQLLEGVAHGWQQSRVLKFIAELEGRTTEEEWVAWLLGFGDRLRRSPASNQDLAVRMLQLGVVGGGKLTELAKEIGSQLLERGNRQQLLQPIRTNLELPEVSPVDGQYQMGMEPQQISLDELWQILQEDASLAEQMADLFQIKSSDPQSIIQALNAPNSSVLSSIGEEEPLEGNHRLEVIEAEFDRDGELSEVPLPTIDEDKVEVWFNEGLEKYNVGDFEGAIAYWDKVLEIDPKLYEVWDNRGLALVKIESYEEAIANYDRLIEIKVDDPQIWNNRGTALANLGRYEEAIESYDRAIEIKVDDCQIWNNRGMALVNLGRYEEGIESYDRAIEIKADDAQIWNDRGRALVNLGFYEEGIVSYDRALEIKPDKYQAWYDRGMALFNLGRFEEEITSLDCAIAIQPNFYQAWIARGKAAGNSLSYDHLLASLSSISKQNNSLNQRGYVGQLASYQEGLKYVRQENQPEGWGRIHLAIGQAHYDRGQRDSRPRDYWRKAVNEYQEALKSLTKIAFPEAHLEVLQELFKALLGLGEIAEAEALQSKGLDLLDGLINESKLSKVNQKTLAIKFLPFHQLRVDLAIQSDRFVKALELAEKHKNTCLNCTLSEGEDDIDSPKWAKMQQLFDRTTAIVYWHLSPSALTTFILKQDSPEPIVLREPPVPEETKFPIRVVELENLVKDWNQKYQEYNRSENKENHTWQQEMPAILTHLGNILDVSEIINELVGITELILIPHRDLHRFPLHYLFPDNLNISYLPSIKLGLNASNSGKSDRLLSVESPNSEGLAPLEYTEIEISAITQMFDNSTRLADEKATKETVIAALSDEYNIFHFTGHGDYNYAIPSRSKLHLSGKDNLTLKEICQLSLANYYLVYLSACDTALATHQTIATEYVGLGSGFISKGVSYVVSTLWKIPDNSSTFLTIEFYRRLKAEVPPVQALKEAQQWLRTVTYTELAQWCKNLSTQLANSDPAISQYLRILGMSLQGNPDKINSPTPPYAHPYHWAAFTITGIGVYSLPAERTHIGGGRSIAE